ENTSFSFLSERTGKGWRRVFFSCYSLRPHPNPLPKGEGVYLQILDTMKEMFCLDSTRIRAAESCRHWFSLNVAVQVSVPRAVATGSIATGSINLLCEHAS